MSPELDQFEQKKVQEVKGSFYLYLPKRWCKKYEIDSAEQRIVYLKRLADDSLLIRPNSQTVETMSTYIIDLDEEPESESSLPHKEYIDYLFNLMLTAYIIGYRTIIIRQREKIPIKIKNRIHRQTRKLYGMVVISENKKEIVIEEHLDEIDLRILSRQLLTKVNLLMNNYIELVHNIEDYKEDQEDLYEMVDELIEQDNQIDEHRYALERYVHQILNYPSLGRAINVTPVECLHYSETTRLIERIGDYILKLANNLKIQPIVDHDFIMYHLRKMVETYNTIQDYYWRTDSMKFFALIQSIKLYSAEIKNFIYENHEDTEYLIPIRRVCNICSDIAEIRINDILSRQQAEEKRSSTQKKS